MEAADARRRLLRAWLAVAAWVVLILVLGVNEFSASNTRGWLRTLVMHILPSVTDADLDALNFLARKGMHLSLYGVLGALGCRALRLSEVRRGLAALGLALLLAGAVAATDESLQTLRPGRTGAPRDVGIDLAGAATGASLLLGLWDPRRQARGPAAA